jgi:uncharacterized protein
MREDADRVLAIMLKAPRPGRVKTRLESAYAPEAIVALYRALAEDTIDLARSVDAEIVAICPAGDETSVATWLSGDVTVVPQRGAGLAAALTSTFEQLCTRPGRCVVAFNGDSPHLPPAVLASAFDALATCDLVVGPSDDGGYYLVGSTRTYVGLFEAATMGDDSALRTLLAQAARLGLRVSVIAEHYDVDLPADVARLAADLASEPRRAPRTAAMLVAWRNGRSHAGT